jgi:hypothetical protein
MPAKGRVGISASFAPLPVHCFQAPDLPLSGGPVILPAFTQGIMVVCVSSWRHWQQRGGEARFAELSAIFTTATSGG